MRELELLIPLLFIWSIANGIVQIVRLRNEKIIKSKLIESGFVDEQSLQLIKASPEKSLSTLKYSLLLVSIGLALIFTESINAELKPGLKLGILLLAAGLSLMLYFWILKINQKS